MPPPLSHKRPFDRSHPIKLTTWRPTTWLVLEDLIEFLIAFYFIWAAFYLIYMFVCGAVWLVRRSKDLMNPMRTTQMMRTLECGRSWGEGEKGRYTGDERGEAMEEEKNDIQIRRTRRRTL